MPLAPIALFTYCRAVHTREAVSSLLLNPEARDSVLYIFSDGPRTEENAEAVAETRRYLHTITGFREVHIIERERNYGLAASLIDGITRLTDEFGRVIVVEDDIVLSPFFLRYMNDALEAYADDERVGAVSAYVYPMPGPLPETFFLRYFVCWGWGTWQRAWQLLNPDARELLRAMRFRKTAFDAGGNAGCYGNLLCQKLGLVDSWWVRFYASLFLAGRLTLYPGASLAENRGMDGSGTHWTPGSVPHTIAVSRATRPIRVERIEAVEEEPRVYHALCRYFNGPSTGKPSFPTLWARFKSFVRRLLYIDCR